MADVSGALSDVSLITKLPYLIPHLPVLQIADCTRVVVSFARLRDYFSLRYRVHIRIFLGECGSWQVVFYPLVVFALLYSTSCGVGLLSIHSSTEPAIRALRTNLAKYIHHLQEQAINQPFARLNCLQNGAIFVSIVPFGTTQNTVLKIERNCPDRHMRFQFFNTLDRGF